ncbi:MAG: EamA family transporter [Roseovarius sp.]
MTPILFGTLAAISTAIGLLLTKSISTRMPAWQVVGPLFLINALLVAPIIPFSTPWSLPTREVLALHAVSTVFLIIGASCVFFLITRGRASGVSVGRAVSPIAVLLTAPIMLGTTESPVLIFGAVIVMAGALLPLRRGFDGLGSRTTLLVLILLGFSEGLVTVLTAMLSLQGIGLPEIYIVRTLIAGIFFTMIFLPKDLRVTDIKPLITRALFVTGGYVFTILGVRNGDVVVVQSLWATAPMIVIILEWIHDRSKPEPSILIGAIVVALGVSTLLGTACG